LDSKAAQGDRSRQDQSFRLAQTIIHNDWGNAKSPTQGLVDVKKRKKNILGVKDSRPESKSVIVGWRGIYKKQINSWDHSSDGGRGGQHILGLLLEVGGDGGIFSKMSHKTSCKRGGFWTK